MSWLLVVVWVGVGLFWYLVPQGKAVVDSITNRLSITSKKLAAPVGLAVAAIIFFSMMFVLQMPFARSEKGLSVAGFGLAFVVGCIFVSIQVIGALVTIQGLAPKAETRSDSKTSDPSENEK